MLFALVDPHLLNLDLYPHPMHCNQAPDIWGVSNLFNTLNQVREHAWAWKVSYNEERPHAALGNIPQAEFKQLVTAEISNNELCA